MKGSIQQVNLIFILFGLRLSQLLQQLLLWVLFEKFKWKCTVWLYLVRDRVITSPEDQIATHFDCCQLWIKPSTFYFFFFSELVTKLQNDIRWGFFCIQPINLIKHKTVKQRFFLFSFAKLLQTWTKSFVCLFFFFNLSCLNCSSILLHLIVLLNDHKLFMLRYILEEIGAGF